MINFKIHFLYYIFLIFVTITGNFNNYVIFTFIILFHELGHILTSLYFKWRIEKVLMLPFGCITIYNVLLNVKLKEEFLVAIMGPIFQLGLSFFIKDDKFIYMSNAILLFNLIPIYPLDGSKILNVFLNKVFPYKRSHMISIVISFLLLTIFVLIFKNNLLLILSSIFLFFKVLEEYKNHNFIFSKFLLERLQYQFSFKKKRYISSRKSFKKDYRHLIKCGNMYITEKTYLKNMLRK